MLLLFLGKILIGLFQPVTLDTLQELLTSLNFAV